MSATPTLAAFAVVALVAALGLAGAARAVETSFDAGVDLAYDSNVTRGDLRDDIRADGHVMASGAATLRWPVGDHDAVSLGAGLRAAQYVRFTRLSFAAAEATLSWQRKLGVGLTAPWLATSAQVAHESYRETLRDSDRLEVRLSAGQRFSERFDGSLGYAYDRRYARHDDVLVPGISGAVWDVAGHSGFARVGYAPTERWQLDAGYAYRYGDVVATTHPYLEIFLASDAIGPSRAFGPDFYDYRLPGHTQVATGTLSYALGDRSSLNFNYAYSFARARAGLEYQGHVVGASWAYRY